MARQRLHRFVVARGDRQLLDLLAILRQDLVESLDLAQQQAEIDLEAARSALDMALQPAVVVLRPVALVAGLGSIVKAVAA